MLHHPYNIFLFPIMLSTTPFTIFHHHRHHIVESTRGKNAAVPVELAWVE